MAFNLLSQCSTQASSQGSVFEASTSKRKAPRKRINWQPLLLVLERYPNISLEAAQELSLAFCQVAEIDPELYAISDSTVFRKLKKFREQADGEMMRRIQSGVKFCIHFDGKDAYEAFMIRIMDVKCDEIDEIPLDIVEFDSSQISAPQLAQEVMNTVDLMTNRLEGQYGVTNFNWENIVTVSR